MTNKRYDISKNAGLCLMAFSLFLSPCNEAVATAQDPAASGNVKPLVSLHNEKLNIKAQSVPLPHLLDSIAKTCDLRIFSASAEKTDTFVDVEIIDGKVEETLATLLKGCNYLVVYNEAKEKTGLFSSSGISTKAEMQANQELAGEDNSEENSEEVTFDPTAHLRRQMGLLSKRIESGISDEFYENAILTSDPSTVTHDRELLVTYEKRLAVLEAEKR